MAWEWRSRSLELMSNILSICREAIFWVFQERKYFEYLWRQYLEYPERQNLEYPRATFLVFIQREAIFRVFIEAIY